MAQRLNSYFEPSFTQNTLKRFFFENITEHNQTDVLSFIEMRSSGNRYGGGGMKRIKEKTKTARSHITSKRLSSSHTRNGTRTNTSHVVCTRDRYRVSGSSVNAQHCLNIRLEMSEVLKNNSDFIKFSAVLSGLSESMFFRTHGLSTISIARNYWTVYFSF